MSFGNCEEIWLFAGKKMAIHNGKIKRGAWIYKEWQTSKRTVRNTPNPLIFRYLNYLSPKLTKFSWTEDEDTKLVDLYI